MHWVDFKFTEKDKFTTLLVLVCFAFLFLFVPSFYSKRIISGVFRYDFYAIWALGIICWVALIKKSKITATQIDIFALVALLYTLLLLLINSYFDMNSISLVLTLFFAFGIIKYLNEAVSFQQKRILLLFILLAYLFQLIVAYKQSITGGFNVMSIKGQFLNPGFYGNYLASVIPLFFAFFYRNGNKNKYVRIFSLGIFIASIVLLIIMRPRAAMIGSLVGCLCAAIFYSKKFAIKRLLTLPLLVVVIIFGVACLYYLKPESAKGRLTIYSVSLNIIRDNPFLGIGPNRFSAVYNNWQSQYFREEKLPIHSQLYADNTFEAFNSILQIGVEYGLIGLLLMTCVVFFLIKSFKRKDVSNKDDWLFIGSFSSIVSIFVSSFFSNPFHLTPVVLNFLFYLSVVITQQKNITYLNTNSKITIRIFTTFFLTMICIYVFRQIRAETFWEKAIASSKYDDFATAKKFYEKALPDMNNNGEFLFNYGAEASLAGEYDLSIKLLERAKKYYSFNDLYTYLGDSYKEINQFEMAEKNYLHAIYIAPLYIYPKFQLVQLYKKWGRIEGMKIWREKAINFPIKIKSDLADELLRELK